MDPDRALVLFSGGQDSTVCLAWALERFARVETVGFDYEQRHRAELEARPRVRERMKTLAPTWAARLGEDHVLELGALAAISDTDFSGYPDCRDDTIKAMQLALNLGMERRFVIHTPLMWIDKAATFALGYEIGGQDFVDLLVEDTHTCYLGDRAQRHDWGYGCGSCPACRLRAEGFVRWKANR